MAVNASGVATFTTSALAVASHTVTATYNGTPAFQASTSAAFTQVVQRAPTSTALVSVAEPVDLRESVTFTATAARTAPTR